jgi:hypothetical protein
MRTSGGAIFLAVLFAGIACSKSAARMPPPEGASARAHFAGDKTEDEVAAKPPETEADDAALAKAIDKRICRKRGCCVTGIEDAGTDRKGRSLVVATIDAGFGGVANCLVPPVVEPAPFGSGALDKEPCPIKPPAQTAAAEDSSGEADGEGDDESTGEDRDPEREDCRPYEHHLIVHSKGKIRARQLLSEACNDGYGASGVGEDEVSVDREAKTFTHSRAGGSAWRWDKSITVGLDPLRVVSESGSTFWTMDEDATSESGSWDWDDFKGESTWSAPDCAERYKQAQAAKKRDPNLGNDELGASLSRAAIVIPRVQLPAAFVEAGWRTIGLGGCAAFVDGNKDGYAVFGGEGRASDATMRVVVSKEGVLFVELTDDRWTRGGKSWVKEDHIELWMTPPGLASHQTECGDGPPDPAARDASLQWGIRISDGRVFPAFGSPEPLAGVEVVRSGAAARAKIPVGDWLKRDSDASSLTVVYSDSDDGLRQKRLIATSRVERGKSDSLGGLRDIAPGDATCVAKGKALRVVRAPLVAKPSEAVADP